MLRFFTLGLIGPIALLAFVACGGDDDDADATPTGDASSNNDTPAGTLTPAESPTATPESPIATPTRVADDEPLMVVNYGDTEIQPTAADLAALPQTTITALDGEEYTGVTLADLGAAVGAGEDTFAEPRGIRSDGIRLVTLRFSIADVGADSVLYVAASGNVDLVSASIQPANWLSAISGIGYR